LELRQVSPTIIRIPSELITESLKDSLTYEDKKVTYEWLKWHKIQKQDDQWLLNPKGRSRFWYVARNSRFDLDEKVRLLDGQRFKSLLFQDTHGYYTYSGLASMLTKATGLPVVRTYELPVWGKVEWWTEPEHTPRWYQSKSVDLLAPLDGSRSHGAVELATGLGKSYAMALLLKRIGLPAVVMAPTLSIANQLLADFRKWFGREKIGQFFDSKKQSDKFFVVAVDASLTKIKRGDKHYENIANKKVMVVDESHLFCAETLEQICFGLLKNIPYRYFYSGTQLRSDGLGLLLDAIIGDVVLEVDVKQGVDEGHICGYKAFMWNCKSKCEIDTDDPMKATRLHLRYNQDINDHAVKLAKYAVGKGWRVLILISEIEQFQYLMKAGILDVGVGFAHGEGVKKEQKEWLPKEYHKSDPMAIISDFDAGKFPILVGSSAVQIGSDIKSVNCIINLFGLTSEVQIRQGVIGRGTRKFPGKTHFVINDYCVTNNEKLLTHAKKRIKIYNSVYGKVQMKEME
jgi:superfamily II DNA or RNA helicase